jgi:hypothetical protein
MSDEEFASRRYGRATKDKENYISKTDTQWPTRSAEAIREALNREKSPFAMDADLARLVNRLFTDQSKLYALGNLNTATVARVAREMFGFGEINLSAPALAAFRDGQAQHADYDFSPRAFQCRVYDKIRELDWDPISSQDVADIMDSMIHDPKEGISLTSEALRKKEQAAKADARAAVRANILQGREKYPVYVRQPKAGDHNNIHWTLPYELHPTHRVSLDTATDELLNQIDDEVSELRARIKGETREEQRQRFHNPINDPKNLDLDRDQPRYSEKDDNPIRGRAAASDSSGPDPFIVDGREITRGEALDLDPTTYRKLYETDKSRLDRIIRSGASGAAAVAHRSETIPINPSADSLFLNPATGLEYTKKELYALAGGTDVQRKIFRKQIATDLARTNRILGAQ